MKPTTGIESLEILNIASSSLVELANKGNLGYADKLYNPGNFFRCVHHISFNESDKNIKLKNPTIKVHVLKAINIPKIRAVINSIYYCYQLCKIVREEKIDLIRARGESMYSLIGLLASKITRVPFVISLGAESYRLAQDLDKSYFFLNNRLLTFKAEEVMLKGADLVFCPNHFIRNYVIELGVKPPKARIMPLRLKEDIFDYFAEDSDILLRCGVDLEKPIVLYIGRFERDKEVEILIEAASLILRSIRDVQFAFVGDGSLRDNMVQRTQELKIGGNVYFLGYQTTEVIKYCLKASSIVWIPKSGFVVYEAAAAGKPIVAFDVDWQSEFVVSDETGILVQYRNISQLSEAVIRLTRDPYLAKKLGENARMKIEREFNPTYLINKEVSLYKELLVKK